MPEPEAKPQREPQVLSSEYHKARKQLMLWAGILFVWELVGIDIEVAKKAGGNVGAIMTAIRSPQAIPWVLLILVGYFLFKTTIEWYQCSVARRRLRVSKIDFFSAWIVSLLAYSLYIGQAISHIQFADLLQSEDAKWSLLFGVGLGAALITTVRLFFLGNIKGGVRRWVLTSISVLLTLIMWPFAIRLLGVPIRWKLLLIGTLSAIIIFRAPYWFKLISLLISSYRRRRA